MKILITILLVFTLFYTKAQHGIGLNLQLGWNKYISSIDSLTNKKEYGYIPSRYYLLIYSFEKKKSIYEFGYTMDFYKEKTTNFLDFNGNLIKQIRVRNYNSYFFYLNYRYRFWQNKNSKINLLGSILFKNTINISNSRIIGNNDPTTMSIYNRFILNISPQISSRIKLNKHWVIDITIVP